MKYHGAQRTAVTMALARALQLDHTAFVTPNGLVTHVRHQRVLLARKPQKKFAVVKENASVESANARVVTLVKTAASKSAQETVLGMANAKTGHANVLLDGRAFLATC